MSWRAAIFIPIMLWGVWYLRHALVTREAPGPPFGIHRDEAPRLYWFFTGTYAAILIIGIVALLKLTFGI